MLVSIKVSIVFIHGDSIVGLRGFLIDDMVLASINSWFNENLSQVEECQLDCEDWNLALSAHGHSKTRFISIWPD